MIIYSLLLICLQFVSVTFILIFTTLYAIYYKSKMSKHGIIKGEYIFELDIQTCELLIVHLMCVNYKLRSKHGGGIYADICSR